MKRTRVSRYSLASSAALVAAAAALPLPARAQDAADAALQAAKAEFEEAQVLFLKEQYPEAAEKFLSAYGRKPFAAFIFNAAVSFEKAGKLDVAVQQFQKYLDRDPDAKDAAEVKVRIQALNDLIAPVPPPAGEAPREKKKLAEITTKGLVIIDSKPPGASIYLNEKTGGVFARTPWQGSLDPTQVKLIVEAKGFKPEERSITPRTDKVYEVYIALSEEHFLGWVEIASNVAGADVFLDREDIGAIGKTPYTGHVKPGKHTVWLKRPGYVIVRRDIEVQPGTASSHLIQMERSANGWISVLGRKSKGARLLVNEKFACNTPCQAEVPAGRHKVQIEQEGMEPYVEEMDIGRSVEMRVNVNFSPRPSRARAWTTAVFSAVFLGGGIWAGLQAKGIKQDLEKESAAVGSLLDNDDPRVLKGKIYAIGADVGFGLAAITGIMSVYNFLKSGPPSTAEVDEKQVGLAPGVFRGGAGLVATGRF